MAEKISAKQGASLVKLARKSIGYAMASGRFPSEVCEDKGLLEERGVFVTLSTYPKKSLRGCIGYPYPVKPLWKATIEAAVQAALQDPRFRPMKGEELEKTLVEVSVLTVPEEIKLEKKDIPKSIKIGKDGLISKRGYKSGLLLPQVATEQGWKAETFLEACAEKAGLLASMWKSKETKLFRFQAQVFSETEPGGKVEEN